MKFTVKTLLERGYSQRAISKELAISRRVVKKYFDEIKRGTIKTPQIIKSKKLDNYKQDIEDWLSLGLTGVLIKEKLETKKNLKISYASVSRFLKQFKLPEVYIPLIAKPGEEAQVDFGYLGIFIKDNKPVKVWCFSIVLSHSRYSYHTLVTNQSVSTFINCHIEAFEFFGGVPETIKLDNLKAGVITPDFYEPTIQRQYAEFLEYYNSAPITARIRRGQDKGKVESGVKYVKNNFLKRIEHNDFYQLHKDLLDWTNNICNTRLHGTTKKIPAKVFNDIEKQTLKDLPLLRYEIYKIEHRKVNNYGHISHKNNFYSVPYKYIGKTLIIKISNTLLRVYDDVLEIALHSICSKEGEFITKQEHLPPEKQKRTQQEYIQRSIAYGNKTNEFLEALIIKKPYEWQRIIKGIFKLENQYDIHVINLACKRALEYNVLTLSCIKNICKNNLHEQVSESLAVNNLGGFSHELKKYDDLFNNNLRMNKIWKN